MFRTDEPHTVIRRQQPASVAALLSPFLAHQPQREGRRGGASGANAYSFTHGSASWMCAEIKQHERGWPAFLGPLSSVGTQVITNRRLFRQRLAFHTGSARATACTPWLLGFWEKRRTKNASSTSTCWIILLFLQSTLLGMCPCIPRSCPPAGAKKGAPAAHLSPSTVVA